MVLIKCIANTADVIRAELVWKRKAFLLSKSASTGINVKGLRGSWVRKETSLKSRFCD